MRLSRAGRIGISDNRASEDTRGTGIHVTDPDPARVQADAIRTNQGGASLSDAELVGQRRATKHTPAVVRTESGLTARRRNDAMGTMLTLLGRLDASGMKGVKRTAMGALMTMDGQVEHRIMDLEFTIRRTSADGFYEQDEAREIVCAARALAGDAGFLSSDVALVRSLLGGARGCRSPRFVRRLKEIWRRENVTFLDFAAESDADPTEAARAA
jgi:hypothetical protein